MANQSFGHFLEGLMGRAHDIDRFLALYRAELASLPADRGEASEELRGEMEDLEDLLQVVEELWTTVAGRTARLYGEVQERMALAESADELALPGEKWRRYFAFAAEAGIRVPAPVN